MHFEGLSGIFLKNRLYFWSSFRFPAKRSRKWRESHLITLTPRGHSLPQLPAPPARGVCPSHPQRRVTVTQGLELASGDSLWCAFCGFGCSRRHSIARSSPPARSILCTPPPTLRSAWPPPDPWHSSRLASRPLASFLGTLLALSPATPLPLPLGSCWALGPGGQAWTVLRSCEPVTAEGTPPGAHGPRLPSRALLRPLAPKPRTSEQAAGCAKGRGGPVRPGGLLLAVGSRGRGLGCHQGLPSSGRRGASSCCKASRGQMLSVAILRCHPQTHLSSLTRGPSRPNPQGGGSGLCPLR